MRSGRKALRPVIGAPWLLAALLLLALAAVPAMAVASSSQPSDMVPILIKVGHSHLLQLDRDAKRVSVGQADVADVVVITPKQIYVNGKKVGTTNISVWDKRDRLLGVYEVRVERDLTRLKKSLYEILPDEPVEVREMEGGVVLSGRVSSEEAKKKAVAVTQAFAPKMVTDVLEVGGGRQVLLKVQIAEVSKKVTKRFNVNIGAFNPFTGDVFFSLLDNLVSTSDTVFGSDDTHSATFSTVLDISSQTNMFGGFKIGDARILGFLDILKANGLAKILAEPTLVATSGQKASFLAGGEFPIPVPDRDRVTILFKEFGVRLEFKPEVLTGGRIRMTVVPEVSELDYTTAVAIAGYTVPGLTTRRAETQLELADGQSFAIAGLFRDDITETISKVPLLGDIPILGALFRSSEFQSKKTELVIVVTPFVVRPGMGAPGSLPTDGNVEPTDFQLFLLGQGTKTPKLKRPLPVSTREMEGRFGHELVF